ncbi:hypothetical protein [Mesorhizobium sp. WSM3626]|uniref:hypothetical protein n=1 Tax=Mesorhizobium sp. WSM3626 TaxID=1040987 RepID=UPI0012ECB010|nr:hypothetical protein [Mesorhizobium sp. WSM3626]
MTLKRPFQSLYLKKQCQSPTTRHDASQMPVRLMCSRSTVHPAAVAALPRGADEDLPENAKPNALRLSLAGVQF